MRIPTAEHANDYDDWVVRDIIRHQWDRTSEGWGTVPDVPLERFSPFALALVHEIAARSQRLLYHRPKLTRAKPLKARTPDTVTLEVQP